jgi:DNA (cytosine-5)-methyltransferase 1
MQRMRAIDLFCGTGGFSRGAHSAGFDVAAAYDIDPILTSSYSTNFPKAKLVLRDIGSLTANQVSEDAGPGNIDLIFGGPPCQGFSSIGRRDKTDPRRSLLQHFFRLIAEIQPAAFVMENVLGLGYHDARPELDAALGQLPDRYVTLGPAVLDAAEFGAATKRKRLFVFGYDPKRCDAFTLQDIEAAKTSATTVSDALSGLDCLEPVETLDAFDGWRIAPQAELSDYAAGLVNGDRMTTGNMRTDHTLAVVERFSKVRQGEIDKIGRHPRLALDGQCPTLRAGTGSDVGSYQSVRPIHPTKHRVITVREAARLQGFPDYHLFHPTIWHSFRMIGNSVSPIIATAILSIIRDKIRPALELQEVA